MRPSGYLVLLTILYINQIKGCFEEPPAGPGNVEFENYTPGSDTVQLFMDEAVPDVYVAILTYTGDTAPTIEVTTPGANLNMTVTKRPDNKWDVIVQQEQDYDSGNKLFSIEFQTDKTCTMYISLQNINDNSPNFQAPSKCDVDEMYALNTGILNCDIKIIDNDGPEFNAAPMILTAVGTAANYENAFLLIQKSINDKTLNAELQLAEGVDFEDLSLHTIRLTATNSDDVTKTGTYDLILKVNDVADQGPIWTKLPPSTQRVIENEIYTITFGAKDGDTELNEEINYRITNESEPNVFEIKDVTIGEMTVNAPDRDENPANSPTVSVCAFEKATPTNELCEVVQILIDDANDNSPVITPTGPISISILEGATSLQIDPFQITDKDLADNGQFLIELGVQNGGNDAWLSAFSVVPTTGYQTQTVQITIIDPTLINYEIPEWRNIALTLTATEVANNSHVSFIDINISVNDTNDQIPDFGTDPFEAEISEDAAIGSFVIDVIATDSDENDIISYTLLPLNAPFEILNNGTVTVKNKLNYEFLNVHELQVQATDSASHKTSVPVTITIKDINDETPVLVIGSDNDLLPENSENDVEVTRDITATDTDTDADLIFSIDWAKSYATNKGKRVDDTSIYVDCVKIDTEEDVLNGVWIGVITVADKDLLDFEKFDALYLNIVVEDQNTTEEYIATKSGVLTVQLENLDDSPPVFSDSINDPKSVVENIGDDTTPDVFITFVSATNPDDLFPIEYSIIPIESTPDGWVKIDSVTGEISTTDTTIDAEVKNILYYSVTATTGTQSTSANITIDVQDRNDVPPVFNTIPPIDPVPENVANGTEIVTLSGTDGDVSEQFSKLCYKLNEFAENYQYLSEIISIDENTGLVTINYRTNSIIDREQTAEIIVNVKIEDNCPYNQGSGDDPTTNTVTSQFTLTITDFNDETPEFDPADLIITPLNEASAVGPFKDVKATDNDDPATDNAKITYAIASIPDQIKDVIILNTNTGTQNLAKLEVAGDLHEKYGNYDINISATDSGVPPLSSYAIYQLTIIDINDNSPVFTFPPNDNYQGLIAGNAEMTVGGPLVEYYTSGPFDPITATDKDSNENGEVTFEITGDATALQYISISNEAGNRGILTLKEQFPSEQIPSFTATIVATDKGSPALSATTNMKMYVVMDTSNEPIFEQPTNPPLTWLENDGNYKATFNIANDTNNNPNFRPPEIYDKIYYYLFEALQGDLTFFEIKNATINEISLTKPLDREEFAIHELIIVASNNQVIPPNPADEQQLRVIINVDDVADYPPVFETTFFGGIAPTDNSGSEIMIIRATDLDDPENDKVTYTIKEGSTTVSNPALNGSIGTFTIRSLQNSISRVWEGSLSSSWKPTDAMKGYIQFMVVATDTVNSQAETEVQVYIIADSDRVYFLFANTVDEVNDNRAVIIEVFSNNLGYNCSIDEVTIDESTGDNPAKAVTNRTSVRTHFIDAEQKVPVDGKIIESRASDYETLTIMRDELIVYDLILIDVKTTDNGDTGNLEQALKISLIVVSVVLGCLIVILFLAYVLKTRSLNKRLKALTTTKFGSQESGLNRLGMQVPNTNKHAVEGSNPVWNENVDYDKQSQSSGDSDLIGVENRPEFGYNTDKKIDDYTHNGDGYYSGNSPRNSSDHGVATTVL